MRKLLKRLEETSQMAPNWSGKQHPRVLLEKQQGKALRRNEAEVQGKESQWEAQGPLGCDIGKKVRWCTRTRPREDKERLKS